MDRFWYVAGPTYFCALTSLILYFFIPMQIQVSIIDSQNLSVKQIYLLEITTLQASVIVKQYTKCSVYLSFGISGIAD